MNIISELSLKIVKPVKFTYRQKNKCYFNLIVDNGDDRFNPFLTLSCNEDVFNVVSKNIDKLCKPALVSVDWHQYKSSWFPKISKVSFK